MEQLGATVLEWLAAGRQVAVARVLDLQGFSTWAGDPLVVVNDRDEQAGDILGVFGGSAVAGASARVTNAPGGIEVVSVEIGEAQAAAAGLVCGGRADLLVQPAGGIPEAFWDALAHREPVAVATRIEGPSAGPASVVVTADGTWDGALDAGDPDHVAAQAVSLFAEGSHGVRRLDDGAGTILIESWVPDPRLVVVGQGTLVDAIAAQAGFLGWQTRSGVTPEEVDTALAWAGGSAALVVLSHDAGIDTTALRMGLDRGIPYVGAMGSRRTQSRRMEKLEADGVSTTLLEQVHRPIGLDLGGRRPAEVALAIVAEILASRHGRDGRPLKHRDGPIHASAPV
jgi:xanthine dehydrogenase accessory factor